MSYVVRKRWNQYRVVLENECGETVKNIRVCESEQEAEDFRDLLEGFALGTLGFPGVR